MEKFGKVIVKLRIPILVLSILLLIPSAIGYVNTRVNYDILYYLPDEIETMQGQDILMDDFNKGAYAMVVVQDMDAKAANKLIKKVENVEHVAQVISYTGIVGEDVPSEWYLQSSGSISRMTAQIQRYLLYSSIIQLQVMTL